MKNIIFKVAGILLIVLLAVNSTLPNSIYLRENKLMDEGSSPGDKNIGQGNKGDPQQGSVSSKESFLESQTSQPNKELQSQTVPPKPTESPKGRLTDVGTYTGLEKLAKVNFKVNDPKNARKISVIKRGYSYGVAKNGIPHKTSVNNQEYYTSGGFNALALDTISTEKVLYLTFDCGYENGCTNTILNILKEKNVKAAFFCTLSNIKAEQGLVARMINDGHIVGNHSNTHPSFPSISREKMAMEIEECDNYLREFFGYTSPYFRFPMGENSDSALDLVGNIGYKAVFWSVAYSDYDTSNQKGAQYALDTVTARLHPGAVILLHSVSRDNMEALPSIIDWARANEYVFKSLDEYAK